MDDDAYPASRLRSPHAFSIALVNAIGKPFGGKFSGNFRAVEPNAWNHGMRQGSAVTLVCEREYTGIELAVFKALLS